MRIAGLVLLFFFLARPVLNPTGLERWLGSGGSIEPGRGGRRLDEHGLRGGRCRRRSSAPGRRPPRSCPPRGRRTAARSSTTSAPRTPVLHDVEGLAARRAHGRGAGTADDRHARRLAGRARGGRRAAAILHLSDAAGHDPDRPAPIGLGGDDHADRRALGRAGVRVRLVDVGDEETRNVSLQSLLPIDRTILAGAESRWEAAIRNDSSRSLSAAKAILRVDDKPTEVVLPDIAAARRGPGAAVGALPGRGAARHLAPAPRRRAAGRQPPMGGRAGEGLAADPPGGRRAVVGAVRVGGGLPGRAAVDRRRRRRGLAGRGRARERLPLAPPRDARRDGAGQRRRPRPPSRPSDSAGWSARAWDS